METKTLSAFEVYRLKKAKKHNVTEKKSQKNGKQSNTNQNKPKKQLENKELASTKVNKAEQPTKFKKTNVENGAKKKKLKKALQIMKENDEPIPSLVKLNGFSEKKKKQNGVDKPKSGSEKSKTNSKTQKLKEAISEVEIETVEIEDPLTESYRSFKWLIYPTPVPTFLEKYWEKEDLVVKRKGGSYYNNILSTKMLDDILRKHPLHFGRNVDVVTYEDGEKKNFNQEGRAIPAVLWDYYSNGCSIRILNPQTYSQKVHTLLATLQEYFGSMVGANVYLTPPGSQGFAPHFDDIEAFVVQLEGRKYWKLYKPKDKDVLARYSSKNFKPEEIGQPYKEVVLNAGDLLYFPRGTIHEGRTDDEMHSLHITISVYQNTAYIDLLEQALPLALKKAAEESVEFRKGLPINYLKHLGVVNNDKKSPERASLIKHLQHLTQQLVHYLDADQGADLLGKKFIYDSMPPVLTKTEATLSSSLDGDYMEQGRVFNRGEISPDTHIRLVRYYSLRLVVENETSSKLYYNTDNAKSYHGEEEQWLTIDNTLIPAIKYLQEHFPNFIEVESIPIEDDTLKLQLVADFWERGLIITGSPLQVVDDQSDYESDSVSDDSMN